MTLDEVIQMLATTYPKGLSYLQEEVLRLAWDGHTYSEMADLLHYQDAYLKNIASQLWQQLSILLDEPINKVNFGLKMKMRPSSSETVNKAIAFEGSSESLYGLVPLNSAFYIKRPPIEQLAYSEVQKPGGVIRIKAPPKMGKSSLILRIIAHAETLNYQSVTIDLKEAEESVLLGLTPFLRWFCTSISRKLYLKPNLDEYWDADTGSKVNCNLYLQDYILAQLTNPLVLIINDVHQLFQYPKLAQDFLPLLRFWHEQGKQSLNWQKLRLVITHTTEIYVPLQYNQSPFNIGLPLTPPEFTQEQVQELALRYGLDWGNSQGQANAKALIKLVGGHPYLIRLAFDHICYRGLSLENLLQNQGIDIYADHLRNHLIILQNQPELAKAWKEVISNPRGVKLDTITIYKLQSLGLLKLGAETIIPHCDLYNWYFQQEIAKGSLDLTVDSYLNQLEQEHQQIKSLSFTDSLTQIPNRRYFDYAFGREWRQATHQKTPLSLIMCSIDNFQAYTNKNSLPAADICLQKVAETLNNCLLRTSDFIARFGMQEFAIILRNTDIQGTIKILKRIQKDMEKVGIFYEDEREEKKNITFSFGVACTIPDAQESMDIIREADKAMYSSIQLGGNRITISPVLNFSLGG